MNKTIKTRIIAAAMTLLLVAGLSTSAFAEGPQGGLTQNEFGQNQQMSSQQGGMQMGGAPQGSFSQNGQQPPEKPEGDEDRTPPTDGENGFGQNGPMNGQQPPEKTEGDEDRTPPTDGENGFGQNGPMNGQQPPEKPEGDEDRTPPADGENGFDKNDPMNGQQPPTDNLQETESARDLFSLFQRFLEWLKNNDED